jgi:hypothetical protein
VIKNDEERRKNREKTRLYRQRHPKSVRAANRAAYAKRRVFITDPQTRAVLLAHPGKIPEVCRVCWQRLQSVNNVHLKLHGLTAQQYKDKFGFNRGQGLHSEAMAVKLSARRRCDPNVLAEHGKKALKEFWEAGGKPQGPLSLQARRDRSEARKGVGRPDLTAVPSHEIVWRWLVMGLPTPQVAQQVVWTSARSTGGCGRSSACIHARGWGASTARSSAIAGLKK